MLHLGGHKRTPTVYHAKRLLIWRIDRPFPLRSELQEHAAVPSNSRFSAEHPFS